MGHPFDTIKVKCFCAFYSIVFFIEPTSTSFCLSLLHSNTNFTVKTVGVSGIRTRIVGVEGEYANHLTTTTALDIPNLNTILFVPMWLSVTAPKRFAVLVPGSPRFRGRSFRCRTGREWRLSCWLRKKQKIVKLLLCLVTNRLYWQAIPRGRQ